MRIKLLLIRWLLRFLDSSFRINYKEIDKKALERWAYYSFDDRGWRSYFAYQDLLILKELSFGKHDEQYWILIGKRLQLLDLFDEMRKVYEMRNSEEEKKKVEASKKNA